MTNQPALAADDFITAEVTTMLFRKPGERHGVDLTAFNLQRNREVGLPSYTAFRKFCGLSPVETFDDLLGSMHNRTVRRYASVLRLVPAAKYVKRSEKVSVIATHLPFRLETESFKRAAGKVKENHYQIKIEPNRVKKIPENRS